MEVAEYESQGVQGMKTCIELKKFYEVAGGTLNAYTIDCPTGDERRWKRPAVIVLPGGGYEHVSKREGANVACQFLARGFQTFVLEYLTVHDGVHYPEQLHELAAAVDYIKNNCAEYHVNRDEIFVLGFSAGGHLAANLAVEHFNILQITGERLDCKPTAVGLAYPVISSKLRHTRSFECLLSGYSEEEQRKILPRLNLDEAVSEHTPPAFIWTTAQDSVVPASNSMYFALALAQKNISYELHVYPETNHGSSICDFEVNGECAAYKKNARWVEDCAQFFRLFTVEKY